MSLTIDDIRDAIPLDSNGYAPSLMRTECCYICGKRKCDIVRHEIFHGANRTRSKVFGLWVNLCVPCHYKVHNGDGTLDRGLKIEGEQVALKYYGWTAEQFIKNFGKNYI